MKRTAVFTMAFILLFSISGFGQDVKVKDDKLKVKADDQKIKVTDDKMKVNDQKVKVEDQKVKMDDQKMKTDMNMSTQRYTAAYSSNFTMGNPAYAKKILDIWADWDDNMLDRHDYFSDSIEMNFVDGHIVKGKQANMEGGKKFRNSLKSYKTTLHAIVPLKSIDRNEDVVCVWGSAEVTTMDGKVERRPIHEVWFFNGDGMIHRMLEFNAAVIK